MLKMLISCSHIILTRSRTTGGSYMRRASYIRIPWAAKLISTFHFRELNLVCCWSWNFFRFIYFYLWSSSNRKLTSFSSKLIPYIISTWSRNTYINPMITFRSCTSSSCTSSSYTSSSYTKTTIL